MRSGDSGWGYAAIQRGTVIASKSVVPGVLAPIGPNHQVPDDLASATLDAMSFGALAVYGFLECRGAIRIDYIVDTAGVAYALEVNTTPGVQRHSNLPVAAHAVGIGYRELILMLLADAIENGVRPPWAVRSPVEQQRSPSPQLEAALPYIERATPDRTE